MNNPVCEVCGHVNRVGAVACEACDARLNTKGWDAAGDPPGDARDPFASAGGASSWAASEAAGPGGGWASEDAPSPGEDIPAPPFRGAGDVISPMLAVYRKHFTLVGILVLVAVVPEALLQYSLLDVAGTGPGSAGGVGGLAITAAGGLLLWLLTMLSGALLSGSLVYAVVDVQRAGGASAGECLARGLKALPKVFLVSLLYAVVTVCGYVMLVVPGVIFSLMFSVCVPAAVVEGLGPVEALKRSRELTEGYKGLIFITYFLWGLLASVLGWVLTWSFANNGNLDALPTLFLQSAALGMLNSSVHVLTVYIYLGLRREHRTGFQGNAFTPGPAAAAR